jgi:DNA-directed RNA polymerase specialized sigma subunit
MFNEVAMLGRKETTKNKYEMPRDHVSKEILEVKTDENALDQMVESYNERLKTKILKEVRRTILEYNVNNNRGKKFKNLVERYDLNVTPTEFARIKGTSQANIWQLEKSAIKVLRDDAYLKRLYEHYKKCID